MQPGAASVRTANGSLEAAFSWHFQSPIAARNTLCVPMETQGANIAASVKLRGFRQLWVSTDRELLRNHFIKIPARGSTAKEERPDRRPDTIGGITMQAIELKLLGYRLTTAEILYHMPDHPDLLQSFVWQELDLAPRFPVLNKFLSFWERSIEGKLHSVRVAARGLISPTELRLAGGEFRLN